MMNAPRRPVILSDHIKHASGRSKTVCVTACLTALGVPLSAFRYTGTVENVQHRSAILRRHGYAVRSRKSRLPRKRATTISQLRPLIRRWNDPAGTFYLVTVWGRTYCHMMLLDQDGRTTVDTSPRQRDRRNVVTVHAVFPKKGTEQ